MNIVKAILFSLFLLVFFSCETKQIEEKQEETKIEKIIFDELPTFSENNHVQAIIEIPAGTSHKYEYNHETKEFEVEIINGKPRIVDYLPYLVNYGFIPSTYMSPEIGGDGDPLDILVIAESFGTGSIVEVEAIAIMKMIDGGEKDYKILAIPVDLEKSIISATTFEELKENYPNIISIIETWFLSYKHNNNVSIEGWGDEQEAMAEIKKWLK